MFAKATANFVRQIDPDGTLINVSRLNDSDKLVPTALVVKRNRFWFWQRPKYQPSDFTLGHLLLGDTPLCPVVSESEFLTYEGKFGDTLSSKLDAKAGNLSVNLEGRGTTKLQSSFGKLRKQEVDVMKLLQDSNERMLDMQHVLVQQMEKRAEVFAVLKERILTTTACSITETHQGQSSCAGILEVLGNPVEVCVKENGNVQVDSDVALEIPPHTVIAYSLIELEVKKSGNYELCLQPDTLGGFEADSARSSPSQASIDTLCMVDGGQGMEDMTVGRAALSSLQKDLLSLDVHLRPFLALPENTRSALYQRLCEVMMDRTTLTDLEQLLDGWCRDEIHEVPVRWNKSARTLVDLLRQGVAYQTPNTISSLPPLLIAAHLLVSALEALPDDSLSLLVECSHDDLEALNTLVTRLKMNRQALPHESSLLLRHNDTEEHWAEQLSSSCVILRKEIDGLWADIQSQPGSLPLVLCVSVHGLTSLGAGRICKDSWIFIEDMDTFAEATKRFVHQVKGDFIPNTVFHDSNKLLHPTRLVVKIKPRFRFQKPKYCVSDFTLEDLLGDLPYQAEIKTSIFMHDYVLELEKNQKGNVGGGVSQCGGKVEGRGSIKLQTTFGKLDRMELINFMNLKTAIKRKTMIRDPELKKNEKLVIVKERVVTNSSFSINCSDEVDASITGTVNIQWLKMLIAGGHLRKDNTSMKLPEKTVLAYTVKELIELNVKDDDELEADCGTLSAELISNKSINCLAKVLEALPDFEGDLQPLASLPKQTKSSLFGELRGILKDRPTFQRFIEDTVEDWRQSGIRDESVGTLLDHLPTEPMECSYVATELLVSVLDALPNWALNMLANCSSSELQTLNKLVEALKTNHSNPLPSETLPPKLQEGGEYNWATQLLCSASENLHDDGNLFLETGIQPGGLLLVLCIAVQGLTFLGVSV
ncbi:gasdermin-E [Osmerus eperlanus]|uniref:gasdermin-E n=1 Tax=Osmerus eperlanus TaxID=29151 RepID=UPI002E0ECCFF